MGDITKVEHALYDLDNYITVPEACELTGVSNVTIIKWCRKYGIGHKIGGRFYIDPDKLSLLLKGQLMVDRHG